MWLFEESVVSVKVTGYAGRQEVDTVSIEIVWTEGHEDAR